MSVKELIRYYDRRIFRIHVPDDLRWQILKNTSPAGWQSYGDGEIVLPADRERILNNIEMAYEYQGVIPKFVK